MLWCEGLLQRSKTKTDNNKIEKKENIFWAFSKNKIRLRGEWKLKERNFERIWLRYVARGAPTKPDSTSLLESTTLVHKFLNKNFSAQSNLWRKLIVATLIVGFCKVSIVNLSCMHA